MNLSWFNSQEKKDFEKIKNLIYKWKLENTISNIQFLLKVYLAYKIGELVYNILVDENSDYEDCGTNFEDNHTRYDSEDLYYDDTDWYLDERFDFN